MSSKQVGNTTEAVNLIKDYLVSRKQTLSVVESVTSGLLQSIFGTCADASHFFQGGITAYNLGQKCRHLKVDAIHAIECNCVSEKMAIDMALSVSDLFTSTWGISVTGYATPVPESGNKLFAYFAIAFEGGIRHSAKIETGMNNPQKVQSFYLTQIIKELLKLVTPVDKRHGIFQSLSLK